MTFLGTGNNKTPRGGTGGVGIMEGEVPKNNDSKNDWVAKFGADKRKVTSGEDWINQRRGGGKSAVGKKPKGMKNPTITFVHKRGES